MLIMEWLVCAKVALTKNVLSIFHCIVTLHNFVHFKPLLLDGPLKIMHLFWYTLACT